MIPRRTGMLMTAIALTSLTWTGIVAAASKSESRQPSGSDDLQPPRLKIHLTLKENAKVGGYLKATVVLTNKSMKPITIIRPGDGSKWHWRTPLVGWSAIPADSDKKHPTQTPKYSGPRCGLMNPLKADDVITLQPNERVQWEQWGINGLFPAPGKYRLVYYYQNAPKHPFKGKGPSPFAQEENEDSTTNRVTKSTAVSARSNEIVVTVQGQ